MADKTISALNAATTPLAGTEVLPIVQSSTTKKVSVSDLTAGRAISATQITATTGNFIVGTAGKGVDFSINPGAPGMTSELFSAYEEGTWTATIGCTGNAVTTNTVTGYYTKIGRQVTATFREMNDIVTTGLSGSLTFTLPFTVFSVSTAFAGVSTWGNIAFPTSAYTFAAPAAANAASVATFNLTGHNVNTATLSVTTITSGVTDLKICTLTYFTA